MSSNCRSALVQVHLVEEMSDKLLLSADLNNYFSRALLFFQQLLVVAEEDTTPLVVLPATSLLVCLWSSGSVLNSRESSGV